MTLGEITKNFNQAATANGYPTLDITDCKYTETIDAGLGMGTYEYCGFPHYYTRADGREFSLGFDDFGDHGIWELFDDADSSTIAQDESPEAILKAIASA